MIAFHRRHYIIIINNLRYSKGRMMQLLTKFRGCGWRLVNSISSRGAKTLCADFDDSRRVAIEQYWSKKLKERDERKRNEKSAKEKYYVLSMFPYPSGKLHMGHVRVYAISDTMARYAELCGKQVIHPMGWDAFGLPAENAAIERGEMPDVWTHSNIASMRKQMDDLGLNFDWHRSFATCDPSYYKWTQYIFLKMYDAGLVYQKESPVNWDPVDMTVLANEQVDENGKSWRSGATVEKKFLRQWYIRTEAFAKSLYDGLDDVDPEMWHDVIAMQREWIGKPDGTRVHFSVKLPGSADSGSKVDPISVFTRDAGCLYGLSHILLSNEHPLNHPQHYGVAAKENPKYIPLTIQATHPLTGENIPVFIAPSDTLAAKCDAKLGLPSCDAEDASLAEQLGLSYTKVLDDEGKIINSQQLTGLSQSDAFSEVIKQLKACGCGGHMTSGKLGDWGISRQRYWGTPIPMMHCEKYGTQPIPYSELPVELPKLSQFRGTGGHSPLEQATEWRKVKCSKCDCGGYGLRETDTMDTFVDSSWYFLRYLSPGYEEGPFDPCDAAKLMPVDLYIGGIEHAVLHLYFARFFMHFLHSEGLVAHKEPFDKLLTQGMVMGRSYRTQEGKYVSPSHATQTEGGQFVHSESGETLIVEWQKMSKSKHNGVDPQEVLAKYGSEATRVCVLSNVAPRSVRKWDEDVFVGVNRWQARMHSLVVEHVEQCRAAAESPSSNTTTAEEDEEVIRKAEEDIFELRNMYVKDVSYCLGTTLLNTAIAHLQKMTSEMKKLSKLPAVHHSNHYEHALADLIIMAAPFSPYLMCELWEGLASVAIKEQPGGCYDWNTTVLDQSWPVINPSYTMSLKVKKDGMYNVFQVKLPHPPNQMMSLELQQALELAALHPDFTEHFGHLEALNVDANVNLEFVPGVRATLSIQTKKKKKKRGKKGKNKDEMEKQAGTL